VHTPLPRLRTRRLLLPGTSCRSVPAHCRRQARGRRRRHPRTLATPHRGVLRTARTLLRCGRRRARLDDIRPRLPEGGGCSRLLLLRLACFVANVLSAIILRGETRYAWIVLSASSCRLWCCIASHEPASVVWATSRSHCTSPRGRAHVKSSIPALRLAPAFRAVLRRTLRSLGAEAGIVLLSIPLCVVCSFCRWSPPSVDRDRVFRCDRDIWWFYSLQHEGGYHLFGRRTHADRRTVRCGTETTGSTSSGSALLPPSWRRSLGEVAAHNLVLLTATSSPGPLCTRSSATSAASTRPAWAPCLHRFPMAPRANATCLADPSRVPAAPHARHVAAARTHVDLLLRRASSHWPAG